MIANFFYKNPQILLLVVFFILASGASCFLTIPRLEDPVLAKRVAVISTVFPGADAQRVEAQVTIRLEKHLRGIIELKEIRSNSSAGISNIVLTLSDEVVEVDTAWTQVRRELEDAQTELPEGCLESDFEILPLKAYASIIALRPRESESQIGSIHRKLARQLRTRIENLAGTESIDIFGDPSEEFVAEVEPGVLMRIGLPIGAIAQQVSEGSVTQPAGIVRGGGTTFSLDVENGGSSGRRLGDRVIRVGANSTPLRLSEIATVEKRLVDPPPEQALVDGEPAIVIGAFVDDRVRVDHWTANLDELLVKFEQDYQSDVEVEVIFSQDEFIQWRLDLLTRNLLLGAGAVTLVVLLLMGWRCMIVVAVTLPLSSMMVLGGMTTLDIPLHQMSVTGLIVALGLLIDNAIVIVEAVRRRIVNGQSPSTAIAHAVRHLGMPLFGSTLTTALAFMPIATLPGPPGEFVGTIAVSVVLAIVSSFLLSMTVLPALLALLKINPESQGLLTYGFNSRLLTSFYRWTLNIVFRFPLLGVLLGAALPVLGLVVSQELPEQFFPASDRNQLQIEVELPAREPIEKTIEAVKSINPIVSSHESVERCHWFVGRSAPTFFYNVVPRRKGTPFYAQGIVELSSDSDIVDTVHELQDALDESNPECRVLVRQLEQGPPFDAPIELRVNGPDLQLLQQLGNELRVLLSQTSNVIHTRSDMEETIPKLVMDVDPQKLARIGLSEQDVVGLVYSCLNGVSAGTLLEGEEDLPIQVRMSELEDRQLDQLATIYLPVRPSRPTSQPRTTTSVSPQSVPLSAVAELGLGSTLATIVRIDGERTNEVKAYIRAGVLPSTVLSEFRELLKLSDFYLPPHYSVTYKGEAAERSHAVSSLIANAVVLFALILLSLVVSFRSFGAALIILTVGGLAIGLGPLALWYSGLPFGFMAIVGTMGLVGIAINDSIVVLAAIREHSKAKCGDVPALVEVVAGSTRHVLATTITTIVGFTPLVLAGGRFWPPLAVTISGGVAGSTFLALYMVPCLSRFLALITGKCSGIGISQGETDTVCDSRRST